MKKSLSLLLTLMLLAWVASGAQAQSSARLSQAEASDLLQKTIGNWQVNEVSWQPETKAMSKRSGKATYSPSAQDISVHEHCDILLPDGSTQTEDGYLRYSKSRGHFEFVKTDAASGKEEVLFTGHWYPAYKTILLTAVSPEYSKKGKRAAKVKPEEWRYVFQNNGTFSKLVHQPDEKGNMRLMHQYNYTPPTTADAELK